MADTIEGMIAKMTTFGPMPACHCGRGPVPDPARSGCRVCEWCCRDAAAAFWDLIDGRIGGKEFHIRLALTVPPGRR
jgi:hypothetical protein